MDQFFTGTEFAERIRCKSREKDELLDLVQKILAYSFRVSRSGVMSLSEEIETCPEPFLKLGIQLILDKLEPSTIRMILFRHIIVGNYHGKEFLQKMIILEGVLGFLECENPRVLLEVLLSLMGEDYLLEKKNPNFGDEFLETLLNLKNYLDELKSAPDLDWEKVVVAPKEFKHVLRCDRNGILRICREIDNMFLVKAIKNLELGFKKIFYLSLPERAARMLYEDEKKYTVSPEEELESRGRILFLLNKLIQSGEVEFEGSEYGLFL